MYKEIVFSHESPQPRDGYVGGGVRMPSDIEWPAADDGRPLTHLFSVPAAWFSKDEGGQAWLSVFIPYERRNVIHYRRLRARDQHSHAVVVAYRAVDAEREETGEALERGRMSVVDNSDADDDQNLASKVDGVDAWLQSPLAVRGFRRRLSIYGGDLDLAVPSTAGILSDGMGYLLLPNDSLSPGQPEAGRFFLQLG